MICKSEKKSDVVSDHSSEKWENSPSISEANSASTGALQFISGLC